MATCFEHLATISTSEHSYFRHTYLTKGGLTTLNVHIPTKNGHTLSGHVFYPQTKLNDKHVLVINPAIGVRMEFYFAIARHISTKGFSVVTYNYHVNHPSSRPRYYRFCDGLVACGATDFEAVLQWVKQMFASHTIHVLGHGIGGSIFGFAPSIQHVKTLITIGSQVSKPSERTRKSWFNARMYRFFLRAKFMISRRFPSIAPETTHNRSYLSKPLNRLRLLSPDIDAKMLTRKPHYFSSFTGRLLSGVIPDEELFNAEASERLQAQFKNAKKATRFLYPEEFDSARLGFFGFFFTYENQWHWDMIINWMLDTLPITEDKYAIFHDAELPTLVIEISHRDPSLEMIESYLETLGTYFRKSPVYMIIDMSRVHWANARFLKRMAQWVKDNKELVRSQHKGTAYACANPIIRYFISFFHSLDVFGVIKPVVVFKTVDQAKKWAQLQSEKKGIH